MYVCMYVCYYVVMYVCTYECMNDLNLLAVNCFVYACMHA